MNKRVFILKTTLYFFIAIGLFYPILNFDFLSYDDPRFIHDHLAVYLGSFSELLGWALGNHLEAYWVPGAWILHAMSVKIFGLWAGGHHLLSVIGHLMNAFLVCSLIENLTGKKSTAWILGAFFLVHPVNVESVYWCTAIRDIYAAFFTLLAVRLYFEKCESKKKKDFYSVIEVLLFLFACMCKPYVIVLPLLLVFWSQSTKYKAENKFKIVSYLFIAVVIVVLNFWARMEFYGPIGKPASLLNLGRYFDSLQVPFLLIQKFFIPHHLSLIYPRRQEYALVNLLLGLSLIFWVSFFVWKQRKEKPMFLLGWGWYLGFLMVPVYMVSAILMADRYLYLPSVGLLIMIAVMMNSLIEKINFPKAYFVYIFLAVVFVFFVRSHRVYASYWKNSKSLFQHMVDSNPRNAVALNQLGIEYFKEGNYEEALKYFKAAVKIPLTDDVRAFNIKHLKNLSAGLATTGKLEQSLKILELIYSEESKDPYQLNELGIVQELKGNQEAAERLFNKVLLLDPVNETALLKLSAIYIRKCDVERGMITLTKLKGIHGKFAKQAEQLKELLEKIEQSSDEQKKLSCPLVA